METTTVIFRRFKDDGSIIAIFPEVPASSMRWYDVQSYQHVGQHGAANYYKVVQASTLARPEEYADLKRELEEHCGYHLVVAKKESARMRETRRHRWEMLRSEKASPE